MRAPQQLLSLFRDAPTTKTQEQRPLEAWPGLGLRIHKRPGLGLGLGGLIRSRRFTKLGPNPRRANQFLFRGGASFWSLPVALPIRAKKKSKRVHAKSKTRESEADIEVAALATDLNKNTPHVTAGRDTEVPTAWGKKSCFALLCVFVRRYTH